ncbi:hypothetical protein CIW49_16245 [Mycolicibacterium sp. P1-18]|nr:hypothetical protein CIW49_16245 [Mycolicibacterium sp. P1-18]
MPHSKPALPPLHGAVHVAASASMPSPISQPPGPMIGWNVKVLAAAANAVGVGDPAVPTSAQPEIGRQSKAVVLSANSVDASRTSTALGGAAGSLFGGDASRRPTPTITAPVTPVATY